MNTILEKKVLGHIISHADEVLLDNIKKIKFQESRHNTIIDALVALPRTRKKIDLVNLNNKLAQRNQLKEIGDIDYLEELAKGVL